MSTNIGERADVVIYGGSSAAVVAAVQVRRMGASVVLVAPLEHLGGMTINGLGFTDVGDPSTIGGLAREFYRRIWQHYRDPEVWRWQERDKFTDQAQGVPAIHDKDETMWVFEPHVAEQVFDRWLAEQGVRLYRGEWLDRDTGVEKDETRILSIRTLGGKTFRAHTFIDATYEGDLLAACGVAYSVGREARDVYDEPSGGVRTDVLEPGHCFEEPVSVYRVPGLPSSGLLPRVSPDPPGADGQGDRRVEVYCYRLCLTTVLANFVSFRAPAGYDPRQYELLLRVFAGGWREVFHLFEPIPNRKVDVNNYGPFGTDDVGMNYDYPEGSYDQRRAILAEHEAYQKGLMYFLANDTRVPEDIRLPMRRWGLARDEFGDNDYWPYELYIREARRMIGRYVMTEHDCLSRRETPEPVGVASYPMDSHNVQRYVTRDGLAQNEGHISINEPGPYSIARDALLPRLDECENLVVPVCVSASHVAYGSIRTEPVFMILGHSAAANAALAVAADCPVQHVDYGTLRERLRADGQVLEPQAHPASERLGRAAGRR